MSIPSIVRILEHPWSMPRAVLLLVGIALLVAGIIATATFMLTVSGGERDDTSDARVSSPDDASA